MPWHVRYRTEHAEMDRQHEIIAELIDQLVDVDQPHPDAQAHTALTLIDTIVEHFAYEEHLMDTYAYPAAETHRQEHISIAKWFEKLRSDISSNQIHHDAFQNFIRDWAKHHIGRSDKELGAFLAGRT